MYASDEGKQVMEANGITPLDLRCVEFKKLVGELIALIQAISKEIGIIK